MGKISASDAQSAARKIVEPIGKKISEIEEQIKVKVTEYATGTVPADVMKVFKSDKCNYITVTQGVVLYGHGFNGKHVGLIGQVPYIVENRYSNPRLELNKTQADIVQKLVEKQEKLEDKKKTTCSEVESMILSLGTHKRVQQEFPEAYGALPGIKVDTGLMIQIQPLRTKVQCLISNDEEKKCIEKL